MNVATKFYHRFTHGLDKVLASITGPRQSRHNQPANARYLWRNAGLYGQLEVEQDKLKREREWLKNRRLAIELNLAAGNPDVPKIVYESSFDGGKFVIMDADEATEMIMKLDELIDAMELVLLGLKFGSNAFEYRVAQRA